MADDKKNDIERDKKFSEALKSFGKKLLFRSDLLQEANKLSKQAVDISKKSFDLLEASNMFAEQQTNILEKLLNLKYDELLLQRENVRDRKREDKLKPQDNEKIDPIGDKRKPFFKEMMEHLDDALGTGKLGLSALALAPFALAFARGFVEHITNGLIDLTPGGVSGILDEIFTKKIAGAKFVKWATLTTTHVFSRVFGFFTHALRILDNHTTHIMNGVEKIARGIGKIGSRILRGFGSVFKSISSMSKSVGWINTTLKFTSTKLGSMMNFFVDITKFFKGAGGKLFSTFAKFSGASGVFKLMGKIAWPITILLGLYDGIKEFMDTKGSFFDKFVAFIGGFLGEIVGAPMNLLADVVAWAVRKLGFENAADEIGKIDVKQFIIDAVKGVGDTFKRLFEMLKNLVTGDFKELGVNVSDYTTRIFSGVEGAVDAVIGFFGRIFGFVEPDEDFSLRKEVDKVWGSIKEYFQGLIKFDEKGDDESWFKHIVQNAIDNLERAFYSAIEWIKQGLINILPDAIRPATQEEKIKELQERIAKQQDEIARSEAGERVYSYKWTPDFLNTERKQRVAAQENLERMQQELKELAPGARKGGIVNASNAGSLFNLHGQEAVIPLDSPKAIKKLQELSQGSSAMSGAVLNNISPVTNNVNSGGNTTNNNSTVINNTTRASNTLDPALP